MIRRTEPSTPDAQGGHGVARLAAEDVVAVGVRRAGGVGLGGRLAQGVVGVRSFDCWARCWRLPVVGSGFSSVASRSFELIALPPAVVTP